MQGGVVLACLCVLIPSLLRAQQGRDTLIVEITEAAYAGYTIDIDTTEQYATLGIAEIDTLCVHSGCLMIRPVFPAPWGDTTIAEMAGLPRFFIFEWDAAVNCDSLATVFNLLSTVATCRIPLIFSSASMPSTTAPDDSYFSTQWEHNSQNASLQTKGQSGAWAITTGDADVTIGFIDTGLDEDHPEFDGRIASGYNLYTGGTDTDDDDGHGTALAGLAGAQGDNQSLMAGVSWGCTLLPVKAFRHTPSGGRAEEDVIATGIVWAVDNGADILNLSFGNSDITITVIPVIEAALKYAYYSGVTSFAAAGNDGIEFIDYPARSVYCIAVGAMADCGTGVRKRVGTDPLGVTCDYENTWGSNLGPQLEFLTPGVALVTTTTDGSLNYLSNPNALASGTSMACAVATGVAALMKSVDPTLSPSAMRQILRAACVDIDTAGYDWSTGFGKLNARAAVEIAAAASGGRIWVTNEVDGNIDYILDANNKVRTDNGSFVPPPLLNEWSASSSHAVETWFTRFDLSGGRKQKFRHWNAAANNDHHVRTTVTATGTPTTYVAIADDIHPASVTADTYEDIEPLTTTLDQFEVRDPWRVTKSGNTQTQDDVFIDHAASTYTFASDANSHGVFLDQNENPIDDDAPYYAVRAPNILAWNSSVWTHQQCPTYSTPPECGTIDPGDLIFVEWSAADGSGTAALLPDPLAGYLTDNAQFTANAVIFEEADAVLTARYKAHMLSTTPVSLTASEGPTGVNSQRKIDATSDRHCAVYESAGEVWYVESLDSGATWSPELRLSAGTGTATHPSIYCLADFPLVTWLENGLIRVGRVAENASAPFPWKEFIAFETDDAPTPNADAAPVLAATAEAGQIAADDINTLVVYENDGDELSYLWIEYTSLSTYGTVPNSSEAARPSLAHDWERYIGTGEPVFHLAWKTTDELKYSEIDVTYAPLQISFIGPEDVDVDPISAPSITCSRGYESSQYPTEAAIAYMKVVGEDAQVHIATKQFDWSASALTNFQDDSAWAPSITCLRRNESSDACFDNLRCVFNYTDGVTGYKTMYIRNDQCAWTSPAEQMTNALHPSAAAFPDEGMELEILSERESDFASGIATVISCDASLGKKNRPRQREAPMPKGLDVSVYPNPFAETTTIAVSLKEDVRLRVSISDMAGRTVAVLRDGPVRSGRHVVEFDGTGLADGTYLCHITVNGEAVVRTIQLIRR